MASQSAGRIEDRSERRDEVFHRTRIVLPDGGSVAAVLVNLSPHGLMVRADAPVAPGERIAVSLPLVGTVAAVVRWSLGGRLGCRLERAIDETVYPALLAALGGQPDRSSATAASRSNR